MFVSLWGMSSLKYPGVVSRKPNKQKIILDSFWGLVSSIDCQMFPVLFDGRKSAKWIFIISIISVVHTTNLYLFLHRSVMWFFFHPNNLPPSNVYEGRIECYTSSGEDQIAIRQFHQRFSRSHTDLESGEFFEPFQEEMTTPNKGWWWEGTAYMYICV